MNADDYSNLPADRPIRWDKFRAAMMVLYKPPLRARSTEAAMDTTFDLLEGKIVKTSDLTPVVVAGLVEAELAKGNSPWTIDAHLRRVRSMANFAVANGWLRRSPFLARPVRSWVRLGRPQVRPHQSREEIARVLELLAKDVEELRGWARWRARRLQALVTGSAQPVALPSAAVPVLDDWLRHRLDRPPGVERPASVPWLFPNIRMTNAWFDGKSPYRPVDRLRIVARRAGVEEMSFHSLRRSLATHLEAHGCGQAMISRVLRHDDPRTTRDHYQGTDVPNMLRAVEDFRF